MSAAEAAPARAAAPAVPWAEAAMEALGLGLFMVSAGAFAVLLEAPASPLQGALPGPVERRALMGLAMGLTAVGLVYSPWGQRSGAHLNPAVTLTFWRLGRVPARTALAYAAGQLLGGVAGVGLVAAALGEAFSGPPVTSVATLPGRWGEAAAFAGELAISFVLMSTVLALGRTERVGRLTGLAAGALVCLFITLEAPVSGMSMNPARTLASAVGAGRFDGLWLYLTAPVLGMLAAAELHCRLPGGASGCAKLFHRHPCLFCEAGVTGRAEAS